MRSLAFVNTALKLRSKNRAKIIPKMLSNPLPGAELGFPLVLCENIFANMHYGYDITTIQSVLLQFCIGYSTYGTDRFLDSLDPNRECLSDRKIALFEYYDKNRAMLATSLLASYAYLVYSLTSTPETTSFSVFLTSTVLYKPFKEQFGELKAVYIGFFWTVAACIIPCVMHDHNYEIVNTPMDYLPCFLTIFGTSNLADLSDIDEDRANEINTLPVALGTKNAYIVSVAALMLANYIFFINPHFFDRVFLNSIFELQNFGGLVVPFAKNITLS